MITLDNIKKDFPLYAREQQGQPVIYVDNASTSQKPQQVLDATITFYTQHNANIYRGTHYFGELATEQYEQARRKIARFIGAEPSEVVFTSGCTESINCIASSWATDHVHEGDEIVITALEHHANLLCWQRVAVQKKAVLRVIPIDEHGMLCMEVVANIITPKTKLVAITHVSNALGTVVDIKKIGAHAHAVGALVLIDAAQSVGHKRINVHELDADFLAFSAHKMLGPTGVGALYVKKSLHDHIVPYQLGGGMVVLVKEQSATFAKMPYLLEAGTPPIAQAIGFAAAVDYLNKIDFDVLQRHEAALCTQLLHGLASINRVRVLGPVEQLMQSGHIVTFVVDGIHPHDVAAYLSNYGIYVRAGNFCAQPLFNALGIEAAVRVSFYLYNTHEDVENLLHVLTALIASW